VSVVVPVCNERDNIRPLIDEIATVMRAHGAFEIICVDDGSRDGTVDVLQAALDDVAELRVVRHARNAGQSVAVLSGVRAARGAWIATLDGDGQNDPADIPALIDARRRADADVRLIAGWRTTRHDSGSKRLGSRLANAVRRALLRDGTPDTGCGTKLFEREAFLQLPRFNHMHRYLPALFQRDGWRSISVPVNHRPRTCGRSKYGNLGRLWVGLSDLLGVAWLIRRRTTVDLVQPRAASAASATPARETAPPRAARAS